MSGGHGCQEPGAHEVDPDATAIGFGPGVIEGGYGGCAGTAGVAEVHHEMADVGLSDIEQVQSGLAPSQQPGRCGIVEVAGDGDDRYYRGDGDDGIDDGIGGGCGVACATRGGANWANDLRPEAKSWTTTTPSSGGGYSTAVVLAPFVQLRPDFVELADVGVGEGAGGDVTIFDHGDPTGARHTDAVLREFTQHCGGNPRPHMDWADRAIFAAQPPCGVP